MHPAFHLPTRVSRLYPIFSLVLLLSSGVFLYAWQTTQIELESLPAIEDRNVSLEKQLASLNSQSKLDKATLQVQKQQIADAQKSLNDITQKLQINTASLANKEKQIEQQQAQLSGNAAELENLRNRPPLFSFNNESSLADIDQKEADIKEVVTNTYGYIQDLYGKPFLLHSIVITFVDEFSIKGSAGEIVIESGPDGLKMDIHLKDFDKNSFNDCSTLTHEMIHAFHSTAVFTTSALEEGMTVAATDAVMQRMMKDGKAPLSPHLYLVISDAEYDEYNTTLQVPADNNLFYNNLNIGKIYQLVGEAWFKLYEQDNDIFKKINDYYYPLVQKGATPDTPLVLDAIRASISQVGSEDINTYLASNRAFQPN